MKRGEDRKTTADNLIAGNEDHVMMSNLVRRMTVGPSLQEETLLKVTVNILRHTASAFPLNDLPIMSAAQQACLQSVRDCEFDPGCGRWFF